MLAIAFDMVVADIRKHYPKGISTAYTEIAETLAPFGFERIQGSVYLARETSFVHLVEAITALKAMPWFCACVRDIRAFRVENWSDFTRSVKEQSPGSPRPRGR
jgi:virulence-associated protein VapD